MIATNITELIRSPEADRLLRLCNERIENTDGSDYAYFRAFCRCMPLMQGHPFAASVSTLVKNVMQIQTPLKPENADEIWRESASFLQSFFGEASKITLPPSKAKKAEFVFIETANIQKVDDAKPWLDTQNTTWSAWEAQLFKSWNEQAKNEIIRLSIQNGISSKIPSIYHVNKALQDGFGTSHIMCAQLLRFLCIACQNEKKMLLIESSENTVENLINLLDRLNECVGLPDIILSIDGIVAFKKTLPFFAKYHRGDTRIGLNVSTEKLHEILNAIRIEYPIHRVFLYAESEKGVRNFSVGLK